MSRTEQRTLPPSVAAVNEARLHPCERLDSARPLPLGLLHGRHFLHSDLGEHEELAVAGWFRDLTGPSDRAAVDLARGRVLDVGAGTGLHSLALQGRGLAACAIDFVPEAVEIMRRRGVHDARLANLFDFRDGLFDTILVLANGIGLAETLAGLPRLFTAFDRLLAPGGQVLCDSTDLRAEGFGAKRDDGRYIGEILFQLEYKGEKAPPFPQLYVDPDLLAARATQSGWVCEVAQQYGNGGYLARLTRLSS